MSDECNVPKDCYGCVYYDAGCPKIEGYKERHPGAVVWAVFYFGGCCLLGAALGILWLTIKATQATLNVLMSWVF